MAKVDIKKAALEHVEKGVFGLILVIVLLALVGSRWKPYSGTPREIEQKVADGRKNLKTNVWPEEERAAFTVTDTTAPRNVLHERLLKPVDPISVELSTKLVADVLGANEPIREPDKVAPQEPIATAGRAFLQQIDLNLLQQNMDQNSLLVNQLTPMAPVIDENRSGEFRRRNAQMGAAGMGEEVDEFGRPLGMPGTYGSLATELETSRYSDNRRGRGRRGNSGMLDPALEPGAADMMQTQQPLIGKGYHFISVRAIFPLRDQIRKFAQAIHQPFHEAAQLFDIRDFQLERQTMQTEAGLEPWSGPWELVDMQVANDILERADGFEADVVSSVITNSVITMPLPMRLSGMWDDNIASHPRVKKFVLSEQEIEFEMEMQRQMLQQAVELNKEIEANTVRRGGFAPNQFDTRAVQADLMGTQMYNFSAMGSGGGYSVGAEEGGYEGEYGGGGYGGRGGLAPSQIQAGPSQALSSAHDAFIQSLARKAVTKKEDPKAMEKKIREWITTRMSADGELLMFRYLDFSVEPGKTYRYRVRFVLANPNFDRRPSDAGGLQHVVEGETRDTPWSKETTPVRVEEDTRYFLTNVDEKPARVLPSARMDTFQWDPQYGVPMNHMLEVRFGQRVAETVKTTVIDPANYFYGEREYVFNSPDYLVDLQTDIQFENDFHEKANDGLAYKPPSGTRGRLLLPPVALMHKNDTLRQIRDGRLDPAYSQLKTEQSYLAEQYAYLKQPVVDAGSVDEFGNMVDADGNPIGEGRRSRSATRRNRLMMNEAN